MKNFDQLCRSIDWQKMEKARITVKNLAKETKSLVYLDKFLDSLTDSATEVHGMSLNVVHPSAIRAILATKAKKQKN